MNFTLRVMAAGDLDAVMELAAGSLEGPRWTRHDYEKILLHTPGDVLVRYALVALAGSALAGFAAVTWLREEPAAEIEGIVVEPAYRCQGIGTALVAACMAWAAGTGAAALRLEARASNVAALALYRRHGFSPVGLRKAYYAAPVEDALVLEAPLLPPSPL